MKSAYKEYYIEKINSLSTSKEDEMMRMESEL
jgi:hypothetical protein